MKIKNQQHKKKNTTAGSVLVEILIAASIILVTFLILTATLQKSVQVAQLSLARGQASLLIEEGAEAVKLIRDTSWASITAVPTNTTRYLAFVGGTWTITSTPNTIDGFTRTILIADVSRDATDDIASVGTVDTGTKKVTVTVSWQAKGTTQTENLIFYVADIAS